MHPLRFPNSGIRAKREGGWAASHGQASCRGGWPWPGHLQGDGRLWPRSPVKGRLAAVSPQGPQAPAGTVACSVALVGATGCRAVPARGYSPMARPQGQCPLAAKPQGSVARDQPVEGRRLPLAEGQRRQRREGRGGPRAFLLRKGLFCPL
ncbi:hypothetical protein BHE74_00040901 [Ensete ventricosum]|nr:hypothetical protein BHE74_00040901 [Ensete ventricosum]